LRRAFFCFSFQKGDAAHLDYADETFDAAVSIFGLAANSITGGNM
jgi:ubiquinone/menaquinone biosynthesis C-methylase UbiE